MTQPVRPFASLAEFICYVEGYVKAEDGSWVYRGGKMFAGPGHCDHNGYMGRCDPCKRKSR